ncbi:hypothetical protein RHGRI_003819 [Rhododendron griersonianum]|uniref:Uncharacterized protein n=1 Tax=Rhododendron griersonianum TaxID=479676 RepID=A0AAV6L6D6_9ERIC|nr:hypothetical protein RHGRI_003819 [Rhododendron griersonianum]
MKGSGSSLCEAKALELGLWSAAKPEGKCSEKKYLIAKAVAALTLRGMVCFDFPNWQKLLLPKLIFNLETLIDSYTKFCHHLRQLEPDRGALIAIAEETINGLRWEYEIYPIMVDGIELHLMELALEEMRKYVPLKGHRKMQLMLEFFEHLKLYMEDAEPHAFAIKLLDEFVGGMHDGLAILKEFKCLALRMFHGAALAPLESDGFGSFDREAIDVVEAAYIERRMQGHRFIKYRALPV